MWYLRHYDGLSFNTFTGDAVYVVVYLGPTSDYQIVLKMLVSAAWAFHVVGREPGVLPALGLTDFSRQRARLLLEFEF
jgi:hypothetical protein